MVVEKYFVTSYPHGIMKTFLRVEIKMIYCCEEHVEIAIDTIVDEYETFPLLSKVDSEDLSTTCEYCRNSAVYVVANE